MFLTIKFILFVVSVGWIGWAAHFSMIRAGSPASEQTDSGSKFYFIFLTGFAVVSICIFLLALFGIFHLYGMLSILSVLFALYLLALRRGFTQSWMSEHKPLRFVRYTFFCAFVGLLSSGMSEVLKPVEAIVMANDASIYVGTSFKLAESGSLNYKDALTLEMSLPQREEIFRNRFRSDYTGRYARFPGGVPIANLKEGSTTFSFYHLFPAWLALGIKALGHDSFLNFMGLFLTIVVISLYFLGREFGGVLLGVSLPVVLIVFYPQVYFSRMPYSELLAQALFLSGLWVIVGGLKNNSLIRQRHIIAGILWGSLFLTRLEAIYIFVLCFVVCFFLLPSLLKEIPKPKTLIFVLVIFALLGLYHQLQRGEYLYLLSLTLSPQWIPARTFLLDHPVVPAIFLVITLLVVFLVIGTRNKATSQRSWARKVMGLAILIILLSFLPTRYWSLHLLKLNITWFFLYVPTELYFVVYGGLLLFGLTCLHNRRRTYDLLLVILFAVTLCVFLVNPMVARVQPMGIRRLIPMFFPLMFLISFSGWYRFLHTGLIQNRYLSKAVFASIVIVSTIFFAGDSWNLIRKDLYGQAYAQMKNLIKNIPEDATVIIPDSEASLHLQIPLQYMFHRNTLLLPLQKSHSKTLEIARSYLAQKLDRNETVMVLTTGTIEPSNLLSPKFQFKALKPSHLDLWIVPDHPPDKFPEGTKKIVMPWNLMLLQKKEGMPEKNEIRFNEPGVVFQNFYLAEHKYRWSQEVSEITGFRSPIHNRKVLIVLSTAFPNPIYSMDDLNFKITVNRNIPANFVKLEKNDLYFQVKENQVSEVTSIRLESRTFVPAQWKLNSDTRTLGLPFVRLRLIPVD